MGNRRLRTERVDSEPHRHHRTGRPLTVFALDLNVPDDAVSAAHPADIRQLADKPRGVPRGAPHPASGSRGRRLSG